MRLKARFFPACIFALNLFVALGAGCGGGEGGGGGSSGVLAESEPNDIWDEATRLGEGSGDFRFKGTLAPDDGGDFLQSDWFKVQTSSEGMARVTFTLDPECLTFVAVSIWQNGSGAYEQVSDPGGGGGIEEIEITGTLSHCPGCPQPYTLSTALFVVTKSGNADCSPMYEGTFVTP